MQQELITFFRGAFLRHDPQRFAVMQPETADRKYDDHFGTLTAAQIAAHLDGRAAYAVPTAQDGLASFLPLDIDAGGEEAARALLATASEHGLWAFAQVDPTRGRGYVWVPFDDLTNAERIHALGEHLLDQVQRPGYRIENRATAEDTRLPFARHAWSGRRGQFITQDGHTADLDGDDFVGQLAVFVRDYRENPTEQLPPPQPAAATRSRQYVPSGPGITIATYNTTTDLVRLLTDYGATPARGQGARLYFCPFHADAHASLLITRDGDRCKCLSAGSDCPLSAHQNDAFNAFCVGEGITAKEALRRLNGTGHPKSSPTPSPAAPGTAQEQRSTPTRIHSTPCSASHAVQPSQEPAPHATSHDGKHLPKTARRILATFAETRGHYWRGVPHLARLLDCDPRTVQRSLRRLEAAGLIDRQQRGRDGHTDVYRIAQTEQGGWQLPPTVIINISVQEEPQEAERGGGVEAATREEAPRLTPEHPPILDMDGAHHGPGDAIAYSGGAAYVPPCAEAWYTALLQAETPQEPTQDQAELPTAEPPAVVSYETQEPPRKRRRNRPASAPALDLARLPGRIIAAERKATKLERGNARDKAQARAIRKSAEGLQRQLDRLRAEQSATHYTADECDYWLEEQAQRQGPASVRATPAPPFSLPGVDFREVAHGLLERLRQREASV